MPTSGLSESTNSETNEMNASPGVAPLASVNAPTATPPRMHAQPTASAALVDDEAEPPGRAPMRQAAVRMLMPVR